MPTPTEIREQLAEILGKVAAVPRESVRDTAQLKDLGIDSIAAVEVAEGIGRGFNLRLDDETVNEWKTVGDVVRSIQREQARQASRPPAVVPPQLSDEERTGAFKQLAIVFALIGAGLGVVIGVGAAALLASSGFDRGTLPPVSSPSIPTPLASATSDGPSDSFTPPSFRGDDTPTPTPTPTESTSTAATLTADPPTVSDGERFSLSGTLPDADPGESLQVMIRGEGGDWEPFPVTMSANTDGTFSTEVFIGASGEHVFRVRGNESGAWTPTVTVRVN